MELFVYTVAAALLLLIVFAFIRDSRWLRIFTVIIIQLFILLREHMIPMHARQVFGDMRSKGELTEEFVDGAHLIVDYCDWTSYFVLAALVIITALCIRGFRNKKTS